MAKPKEPVQYKYVRVAELGGKVETACLADAPQTVADAVKAVGFDLKGKAVQVNGRDANSKTPVIDGDRVTLAAKVEGGTA